jgi:hypothetical protein
VAEVQVSRPRVVVAILVEYLTDPVLWDALSGYRRRTTSFCPVSPCRCWLFPGWSVRRHADDPFVERLAAH